MPHLNSAYNFARWLTRNDQDAEDIVQEAYLRAFRFYDSFRGGDVRPWLLKIVRNTYRTWLHQNPAGRLTDLDDNLVGPEPYFTNPEEALVHKSGGALFRRALDRLPTNCRETLVLRELEGMSYKEISTLLGVPTGTVMSRLARARARLRQSVTDLMNPAPERGVEE